MNNWHKAILVLSGTFCALAFGALGWLAVRTMDPVSAYGGPPVASGWDAPGKKAAAAGARKKRLMTPLTVPAGLTIEQQIELLTKRLLELKSADTVMPGELMLTFKDADGLEAFRRRAAAAGFEVLSSDPRLLAARVRYADPAAMARELQNYNGDYGNIGLNYLAWVPGLPDEPAPDAANQGGRLPYMNSGLEAIGAVGDRKQWGRGVTVAVLDTGVTDHTALLHTQVYHYDLVNDGEPFNGHGTSMATLIAGDDPENGGVALASRILDIRVADVNGESNTALVADGIMQAVDQGAKVINISLGSTGDSLVLRNAVLYAQSRGVVVVAAAGNEQQQFLSYPAGYEAVISVGAVDAAREQAYFSNSGENLSLTAPGVGIISGYSDNRVITSSGTSLATAITSGVVSSLLSRGYSAQNVKQELMAHARPTGAPARQVGAGVLRMP